VKVVRPGHIQLIASRVVVEPPPAMTARLALVAVLVLFIRPGP
jgi:hypothetical protein